jgi:glycosyltransferase involved in cell wall biosynthesis
MHVLIIPSWYKTPENPVIGTFFEEQARMLQNKGFQVGILYPDHLMRFDIKQSHAKKQLQNFIDNGIPTYYSYTNSIIPRTKKINYWYACQKALLTFKKYKKKYGMPDVIHAHATFIGGLVANAISKKYDIPYILTEHYTGLILDETLANDKTNKSIIKKVFLEAKRNIIVSNFFKQELILKYKIESSNLQVIANLVNPIFYTTYTQKEISLPFNIVCTAFLTPRKQHKLLFDALCLLNQKGYFISLKLIGDGAYKDELLTDLKNKNIMHLVTFMGNQPREVIKQEIDNAHIVVSASKFETFGVNLIEALACGRPVVAIDSGGPRDIITRENGILVLENTAESLAMAIEEMIANYENYDQCQIVADCISRFSEDAIFEKLEKVYK